METLTRLSTWLFKILRLDLLKIKLAALWSDSLSDQDNLCVDNNPPVTVSLPSHNAPSNPIPSPKVTRINPMNMGFIQIYGGGGLPYGGGGPARQTGQSTHYSGFVGSGGGGAGGGGGGAAGGGGSCLPVGFPIGGGSGGGGGMSGSAGGFSVSAFTGSNNPSYKCEKCLEWVYNPPLLPSKTGPCKNCGHTSKNFPHYQNMDSHYWLRWKMRELIEVYINNGSSKEELIEAFDWAFDFESLSHVIDS